MSGLWLSMAIVAVLLSACRRGVPVVDVGARPPDARGTLAGIIRGPDGTSPIVGRDVQIVNTDTGAHFTARSGGNGGFTIQLPAGNYRIDLLLRDGETLVKRPGIVDLGNGDIDSRVEFVLASVRVVRPRGPAYRLDNGLGSPIT